MYPLDDFDQPDFLTLQSADRFHCILHSGEVTLPDKTRMVLVIFVVRRAGAELFDMFIINRFFLVDGDTNRTFMSKKDLLADEIEHTISSTSTTFSEELKRQGHVHMKWDELDLRKVAGREKQIECIKKWGKLANVQVKTR